MHVYQFYVTTEEGTQYFFLSHNDRFSPEEINALAKQALDQWKTIEDRSDVLVGFMLDYFVGMGFFPFTPEAICEITEHESVILSYEVPKQDFKQ